MQERISCVATCRDAAPVSAPDRKQPFAGLLPDSEVIQRIELAESSVKHAFRGVCPPPDLIQAQPHAAGMTNSSVIAVTDNNAAAARIIPNIVLIYAALLSFSIGNYLLHKVDQQASIDARGQHMLYYTIVSRRIPSCRQ